jgi:hypothetical protein
MALTKAFSKTSSNVSSRPSALMDITHASGGCSMSDIIQFPKKESFIKKFGPDLPDEFAECISNEYDRVLELYAKSPNINLRLQHPDDHEKVKKFTNEYKAFVLEILTELIVEKVNKCQAIHAYGIDK